MASSSNTCKMRIIVFSLTVIILLSSTQYAYSCYSSIFSFGDSLTDTGNLLHIDLSSSNSPPHFGKPPYGKSYFYAPTGRCSDGRLVVDFIDYKKVLKNSLIVMGEIGGNDYNHALLAGRSLEEVQSFMTPVINEISSAINELINLGAVTFMVPGYLPIGCSSAYLAQFESANKEDYDLLTGCLNWLNEFAQTHNERLQIELNRIQQFNPHATIIYADFYNAAMPFYRSPKNYGFTKSTLVACCGGGGAYNYNASLLCGDPPSTSCDDPSLYANWDGLHLTDAANRIITKGLFEGPNTIPHINNFCPSKSVASS
ncbi:hypothetical protein LguiB_034007 [Lonicera macranthoides]